VAVSRDLRHDPQLAHRRAPVPVAHPRAAPRRRIALRPVADARVDPRAGAELRTRQRDDPARDLGTTRRRSRRSWPLARSVMVSEHALGRSSHRPRARPPAHPGRPPAACLARSWATPSAARRPLRPGWARALRLRARGTAALNTDRSGAKSAVWR
jgi:hypothetical protein